MKQILPLIALGLLTACDTKTTTTQTTTTLPLFGDGYRADGDQCRRVGESAATVEYLDHTADLVACPEDYEGLGVFQADTGGVEVARIEGWVLFSVSREG
ncbi:hypothetical protein MUY21_05610 [Aliiroseovarius sp. S2029]|uniref:hypothetical protein n=1 Tax=Aliiroseovarius sp. S2029 TaxID=2936988 RepID=UPI0020BDC3B9|nr:hypothetical protein [Aliiroseovarius sp. S2029]MCK8483508.1 hypothetical protein [Aliiroseovarius sp. S2029]